MIVLSKLLKKMEFRHVNLWATFPNCSAPLQISGFFWGVRDDIAIEEVAILVCPKTVADVPEGQSKDLVSFWVRFIPVSSIVMAELLLSPLYKELAKKTFRCQTREGQAPLEKNWPEALYDFIGWRFPLNGRSAEEADEELKQMISKEIEACFYEPQPLLTENPVKETDRKANPSSLVFASQVKEV
jgi:hypothetical protein